MKKINVLICVLTTSLTLMGQDKNDSLLQTSIRLGQINDSNWENLVPNYSIEEITCSFPSFSKTGGNIPKCRFDESGNYGNYFDNKYSQNNL